MEQGHASAPKFEQMKLLGKIKPKGHWLEILKESMFKILFSSNTFYDFFFFGLNESPKLSCWIFCML